MGRPPRRPRKSGFAMRRKLGLISGARKDGDVRPLDNAGAKSPRNIRRRPRVGDNSSAQRNRKCALARPIGLGEAAIIEPSLHVTDDLPQAIPLAKRELDVIETYLGALLDDVLGRRE